ncbi:MAG: phosphoadenylyl-sulfate reductase [Phototrophicales bacterium]
MTQFEHEAPQTVLRWAVETFKDRLAVVTSFQPTGIATIHMLSEITDYFTVITLDTGLLFPETYQLMDEVEKRFPAMHLIRIKPALSLTEQTEKHGENLWQRDPNLCCHIRKVVPLDHALQNYDAWIAGLRRDQSSTRKDVPVVGQDRKRPHMTKICPFATWSAEMLEIYINAHELPYNTLHDQGYTSIGCYPCTRPITNGEDSRAGRWANSSKIECGIHQ